VKIALLPSAYAPAVGGVEVLTGALARQFLARNHEVEVWTARSSGDTLPHREILDAVEVRRFAFELPRADPRSLSRFLAAGMETLRQLRAAATRFQPDVLHVHCFSGNGVYATVLSRLTGIPLIVTLHGETFMDDNDIFDHSVTLRTSLRLGLRRAAAVTGCSAFTLGDAQQRFGLDMRKAEVIFSGIDVDETTPVPVALPVGHYVLGLGRLVRKKGFDLLLEAFARIASEHPDIDLVIAGEGVEREPLSRRAFGLGLGERVHLPGRLDRAEVAAVMQGADVFVMPSRIEPFGMVALEAWLAGTPVIATPHGGPPEFIKHGVSGLIADPHDPADLAFALGSLLASPALRERLAEAGREELPRFGWDVLAEKFQATYMTVTAQPTTNV
jgi:glycogen synthase